MILCSQLDTENWSKLIENHSLGESIRGRITASSYTFLLGGDDMRKRYSDKP